MPRSLSPPIGTFRRNSHPKWQSGTRTVSERWEINLVKEIRRDVKVGGSLTNISPSATYSVQHISQICIRMFSKNLCWLVLRWSRICGWSQNESAMILLHLYITAKVTTDICWAHMPISLHNYQIWSEEEGATIPNVVKTIWIHHNSLAWFVLVCECLGWFHHSSSNMDHCGTWMISS